MSGPLEWVFGILGAIYVLRLSLDLSARVARFRRYRRMYPAVDRGRVWQHVR